jgi:hypothetical protein
VHQWTPTPAPVRSSRKNPAVQGLGLARAQCPSSRPGRFIPTPVIRPFFGLNIQTADFSMSRNKALDLPSLKYRPQADQVTLIRLYIVGHTIPIDFSQYQGIFPCPPLSFLHLKMPAGNGPIPIVCAWHSTHIPLFPKINRRHLTISPVFQTLNFMPKAASEMGTFQPYPPYVNVPKLSSKKSSAVFLPS